MNKLPGGQLLICFLLLLAISIATPAWAQTCSSGSEIEAPAKAAIDSAVAQYFQMAQNGNIAGLQSASASDFTDISTVVSDTQNAFVGSPTTKSEYLLDNTGQQTNQGNRTEFFCGIFNSPDRVGFAFPSLPAGLYSVIIQSVTNNTGTYSLSWILHQIAGQWKIAGLIAKNTAVGGHDGNWFIQQARDYKSKGQLHNAWFYFVTGNELLRPFGAMSTPQLDKLYDEFEPIRPSDLPTNAPVPLAAQGKTFNVTSIFPTPVGDAIDLVVKYQSSDVSDVSKAYQDNMAVIKGIVNKYPELRDAFGGIVARAVAPSGQDYGTLLAMKDVK